MGGGGDEALDLGWLPQKRGNASCIRKALLRRAQLREVEEGEGGVGPYARGVVRGLPVGGALVRDQ